jgi:excisionase family DNA binding protein
MMRDKDFGVIRLRAFGTYDFRITNAALFLKEVAGTDQNFRIDEFADTMRSRIVSIFSEALAKAQVPALDVAQRYSELGDALLQLINPAVSEKYGLEITSFLLENVSVPPEVEQAIDKRSSMGAIGNLNDYVKYQMGQAMANGGEGAAAATIPATMAMGFGMAQEMMKGMQGGGAAGARPLLWQTLSPAAAQAAQTPAAPAAAGLQVLTPAQAAQVLGVAEADVLAEIQAGNLKARQIGSQWRIAQAALDEFLRG